MRKVKCIFMCVLMLMGLFGTAPIEVNAEEVIPEGVFEFVVDEGPYKVGDIIEVKWYVHDYVMLSLDVCLAYDPDILYIDDYDISYNKYYENGERASVSIDYYRMKDIGEPFDRLLIYANAAREVGVFSENGYFITFPFQVKQAFEKTTIRLENIDVCTEDYGAAYTEDIECTVNGTKGIGDASIVFAADAKEGKAGEIVEMPLLLTQNSGFNAIGVTIAFDSSICTYNGLDIGEKFKDKVALQSIYEVPGKGILKASFIAAENITDIGTFLSVSFRIKDGMAEGNTCNLRVGLEQITNKEESAVYAEGVITSIMVTGEKEEEETVEYISGDVNEDGNINLTDAVYILLHYNGEMTFSEARTLAADTNGDEIVNLLDALQVMKYFNGEISAFQI